MRRYVTITTVSGTRYVADLELDLVVRIDSAGVTEDGWVSGGLPLTGLVPNSPTRVRYADRVWATTAVVSFTCTTEEPEFVANAILPLDVAANNVIPLAPFRRWTEVETLSSVYIFDQEDGVVYKLSKRGEILDENWGRILEPKVTPGHRMHFEWDGEGWDSSPVMSVTYTTDRPSKLARALLVEAA